MRKLHLFTAAVLSAVTTVSSFPLSVQADTTDVVYGTMNIPYADFYAAEIGNAYEVDAVSSATTSKWAMNTKGSVDESGEWKSGGLVAGTYNDGNGKILGVNYPVAVSSRDVDFLTENYGFEAVATTPTAYKTVTVDGSSITVSALNDTNGSTTLSGEITLNTLSRYGDYQLSVPDCPQNCDLYGVIVNTAEGDSYALRHLENIWRRGEISWSVGIKTTEAHGNTLSYEDYVKSNGQTVVGIRYITLDGYVDLNASSPVKLLKKINASVTVENSASGTGTTSYTLEGFPSDYEVSASVADGFSVENGTVTYEDAFPGSYTLTISDANNAYAPFQTSFVLSTSEIPVTYADGKLVAAEGFSDEYAANFIGSISSVTVNGTAYNTGRRGVTIIQKDGTIDFSAEGSNGNVFDGSGNYTIIVQSNGYNTPYELTLPISDETTDGPTDGATDTTKADSGQSADSSSATDSAVATDKTTDNTTTDKTASATSNKTSAAKDTTKTASAAQTAPKTGDHRAILPLSLIALAAASAFTLKKAEQ